jgi:hypothetical protein
VPVSLSPVPGDLALTGAVDDIISQTFEPDFIRSANFMQFKFDAGSYALAGREKMLEPRRPEDRVLPEAAVRDEQPESTVRAARKTPSCDKEDEFERDIEQKMNKVSLVTLWVDPAEKQILKYEFRFQDLDFLPGRTLVRFEKRALDDGDGRAVCERLAALGVGMRFRLGSAVGPLEARYDVKYRDYRLPR